jgi:hypothetical protein
MNYTTTSGVSVTYTIRSDEPPMTTGGTREPRRPITPTLGAGAVRAIHEYGETLEALAEGPQ